MLMSTDVGGFWVNREEYADNRYGSIRGHDGVRELADADGHGQAEEDPVAELTEVVGNEGWPEPEGAEPGE